MDFREHKLLAELIQRPVENGALNLKSTPPKKYRIKLNRRFTSKYRLKTYFFGNPANPHPWLVGIQ